MYGKLPTIIKMNIEVNRNMKLSCPLKERPDDYDDLIVKCKEIKCFYPYDLNSDNMPCSCTLLVSALLKKHNIVKIKKDKDEG